MICRPERNILFGAAILFRSPLKTIVPQMRSQIFRQFVRLYRNFAGILPYVKKFMCKMTENLQADEVLRL